MDQNLYNSMSYALITGASRGLGKEIALELALRKINLLLVSLRNEGLPDFCEELTRQHGIQTHYMEADLSESRTVFTLAEWAISKGNIHILVNNAGIGGTMAYEEAPVEFIDSVIQVNIRATSLLTRLILPALKNNKQSYILNVSSLAAFCPIAYKTVYPASKAFIRSFSKGLAEELKNSGVHISVVHPGPMRTNHDATLRIENQSLIGKLSVITTSKIAKTAVNGLFSKNVTTIPGLFNKLNWLLSKLVPLRIKINVVSRVMKKDLDSYLAS